MTQQQEKPTADLDIWLLVDQDGDFVLSKDEDDLGEQWSDQIGGTPLNSRTVKLTLTMTLPFTIEARGVLPDTTDDAAEIKLTVSE